MIFNLLCTINGFKIGVEVRGSKVHELVQLCKFFEEFSGNGDRQREEGGGNKLGS